MCVVYDLTEQYEIERDMNHKNLVIQKLCDRFDAICYINLDTGIMIDYRVDNVFHTWEDKEKENFTYEQRVEQFANTFVMEEDKEKYKKNTSISSIINWDNVNASSELIQKSKNYKVENVIDNNKSTAWIEGVDGDGIGEYIKFSSKNTFRVDKIDIINGLFM